MEKRFSNRETEIMMRFFLMICFLNATAWAATINIPTDYPNIQDGINMARPGDTVLVAPGTYHENIKYNGKAIIVKSLSGADITIIEGDQTTSVVTFKSKETSDSVLDGFTITNGKGIAFGTPSLHKGGGILCIDFSSPTITNNIITKNLGNNGSGVHCEFHSSPIIMNNTITHNKEIPYFGLGGGICCEYNSSPVIQQNIISHNSSGTGGGIALFLSFSMIEGNTILDNIAAFGAGINCDHSKPVIKNNIISNNIGGYSGGINCTNSSPFITGNIISDNRADDTTSSTGAGLTIRGGYDVVTPPVVTNNIISKNFTRSRGGGIFCAHQDTTPIITNNAIIENTAYDGGGGIYCEQKASPIVTNTILWNNSAAKGPEIEVGYLLTPQTATLTISYSNVKGGLASVHVDPICTLNWGAGMIDADPLFVDEKNTDFHLTFPSPCKDTGSNQALDLPNEDFEGDPRIANGTADMGVDEFHSHLYYTGNASPGGNIDLKLIDIPNTSPTLLWLGSGVLNPPITVPVIGDWYLKNPILMTIPLGAIPSPDGVLVLPVSIPSNISGHLNLPLQAGVGMKLTNLCELKIK